MDGAATDKRITKTKETIKQSLFYLMHNKYFGDITVSELCKQAQISRSTFYAHYNNVNECIYDIYDSFIHAFETELLLKRPEKQYSNAEFADTLLKLWQEHQNVMRPVIKQFTFLPVKNYFFDRAFDIFVKHAEEYICDYHKTEDDFLRLKYQYYGVIGLLEYWAENDFKLSVEHLIDIIEN